jgi:hypothetical protein
VKHIVHYGVNLPARIKHSIRKHIHTLHKHRKSTS